MAMKNNSILRGVMIMLLSSVCTCVGQLCWKLFSAGRGSIFVVIGFVLYGCGAILMITALKYGELSKLHPMLSAGYILSLVLGALVLGEHISASRVAGIIIIILGLVCLNLPERKKIQ